MKWWHYIILALCLLAIPTGVVLAGHISNGLNRIPIFALNNGTLGDLHHVQVPFILSSQSLIDGLFMDADAFNTDVREGDEHRPFMPATARVQMLACFANSGGDETAECNATLPLTGTEVNDMTLPATGSHVYEFAADNQFRHQWLNIGAPAVADWEVVWEYYDGAAYVEFDNVSDGTNHFRINGLRRVTWDFPEPDLWIPAVLHSIRGYWVRARVDFVTSVDTPPLASQAWYETGRWWTFAVDLLPAQQLRYDLHLDTGDDLRDWHHYFPHPEGIVTADHANLEPAANADWELGVTAYFNTDSRDAGKIVWKEGALECSIPVPTVILCELYE